MTNPQNNNPPTALPESDQDNADILVDKYLQKIRYVVDAEAWYVWNGNVWEYDHKHTKVINFWTSIARQLPNFNGLDARGNPKPYTHRKYSLSAQGSKNVETVAKRDVRIQIRQADLDAQPYELNTPKGIVNLRTGKLVRADPKQLHTKQTNYTPDKGRPDKWLKFLTQTFLGDEELIEYMQRLMGMALIGEVTEQVFPFAWGPAGTGKSTFFQTITSLLGNYAASKSSQLLMKGSQGQDQRFASLHGVRMVNMSELNEGSLFDEATLKLLTGNDNLEGRHLYQSHFSFMPSHTLFLFGNFKPSVKESGQGVWRRMRLIPFTNTNVIANQGELRHVFVRQEGAQILQWLVEGAQKYLESGLSSSTTITTMTDEYEAEEDIMGQFIDERCLVEPNASVSYTTFRQHYVQWCEENGYKPYGRKQMTQRLTTQGKYGAIGVGKIDRSTRGYLGITVHQPDRYHM